MKILNMASRRSGGGLTAGVALGMLLCLGCARAGTAADPDEAAAFRARVAEMADVAEGLSVAGLDGWLFLANELRFVGHEQFWGEAAAEVSRASNPEQADPLPAIVGFHEGLTEAGVALLVVPVPPKVVIFPDGAVEGADAVRMDAPVQAFYEELRGRGLNVLDLTESFLADREGDRGPIYCRTDTHWAPRGCEIAAAAIADWIRERGLLPGSEPAEAQVAITPRVIRGDLLDNAGVSSGAEETLSAGVVGEAPIGSDPASPVILMGDSHTLVFSDGLLHGDRAGLADHLSRELGMPMDLSFRNKGSGSTVVRTNLLRQQIRSTRDGEDYLAGKKVVVWCFAARELTESTAGWRVLPVTQ